MSLTDKMCKGAKPKAKSYKLADSNGLYLLIMPNGAKYWRLKYRFAKKEKLLAFGIYPDVSLADARNRAREAKKNLAEHIDPSQAKKELQREALKNALNPFKEVALAWMETKKEDWTPKYYKTVERRMDSDIFPYIGDRPISKIETVDLYQVIKKIEARGALHLIKKMRQYCGQVFTYAMLLGLCQQNPALNLQRAFKTRKTKHHAAIEASDIPQFLNDLTANGNRLYPRTVRAVRLSLLTFVRPNELRKAKWADMDFEKMEWRLPAEVMKSRRDFIVPLSKQAVLLLKEQKLETGRFATEYVFPHQLRVKEPMSNGTVLHAIYRLNMKDKMTAHGFRALARTAIREELGFDADVIEIQLAHKPTNSLGEAYDRAKFLIQRKDMMQKWADYLDKIYLEYLNKKLLDNNLLEVVAQSSEDETLLNNVG